jgi:hypothetical protein
MPETPTAATDPATPATPAAAAPTTDPPAEPDWKAEARKWESRAKDNRAALDAAAPKLKEYETWAAASKTNEQRLQEAANAARQEADEAKNDALRFRIALKHGIAEEDFDFLGSGTEQELETRAARLAAKNAAAGQPAGPRPPAPNPAQGSQPGAVSTPREAFASFLGTQLAP